MRSKIDVVRDFIINGDSYPKVQKKPREWMYQVMKEDGEYEEYDEVNTYKAGDVALMEVNDNYVQFMTQETFNKNYITQEETK